MLKKIFVGFLLSPLSGAGFATPALIDGNWLKQRLDSPGLFLLDIQETVHYQRYHVPGAVNAPYGLWRTGKESKNPGMLPSTRALETLLVKLGVNNDDHVIIVATGMGAGDMAAAARVLWTMKSVGHEKISILDGGLADYANRFRGPLDNAPVTPSPGTYQVRPNLQWLADESRVKQAIKNDTPLLDARSLGEFKGLVTGGGTQRGGTLPDASHLPFEWFFSEKGRIHRLDASRALYQAVGLNPDQDGTIHFCQSGNRAALSWFVDYAVLGNTNARLYDASMAEWARLDHNPEQRPMHQSIKLP